MVLRYYNNQSKGWIQPKQKRNIYFLYFRKGIKENGIKIQNTSTINKKAKGKFFQRFGFGIVLAAWPSGKAGDCKSFFPSSNPGVA